MGFYCVLTLSPDVPYLFLPKIGQKRQNWRFLGIFGDIYFQIWRHFKNLVILGFWPFLQCCQMVQIQNHQKLVKNAKIGNFWGKFTSKSGNALKSDNFNDFLRQIVTSFFIVLSKKIQCCQMIQIKNRQNRQKLRKNANIW